MAKYNFFFLNELGQKELNNFYSSSFLKDSLIDPLYSKLSQEFYSSYNGSSWEDVSVAASYEGSIIGYIIAKVNNGQASYFNFPIYIHIDENLPDTTEVYKSLFSFFLDNLTLLHISNILVDSHFFKYSSQFHLNTSKELQIAYINLQDPLDLIKRNIRKSYKSFINWGEKNFNFITIDKKNLDRDLFKRFMLFHHHVSGRITRSEETWNIQYKMIKASEAFAVIAFFEDKMIGGLLIIHSDYEAYYAVGVYDRDLMQSGIPVAHSMLFKAISIAKKLNVQSFILGDVSFSNSTKEQNIAKFKLGFAKGIINKSYYIINTHSV
jgi:hypothetical protein